MLRRARRVTPLLLLGTVLGGTPVLAQVAPGEAPERRAAVDPALRPTTPARPPAPFVPAAQSTVRAIVVRGTERLEPETVRSYIELETGDAYDRERLDKALKALYASELFADVTIRDDNGTLIVEVKENPVINRILVEGAKRVKEEKIREEIRVAPRQIFTRSKARADVARILELYRRSGRFAASVEPKIVQLDQNRVDLIFEIHEGNKSKVRQINILGNVKFKDGALRSAMATRQARPWRFFTSQDTYDPDRLAYDQQKLKQFYLTEGYADFRVVSSTAELTPDRKDFIVSYVIEEGERYKFGRVELDSQIRDIKPKDFKPLIKITSGEWYNAQKIENSIDLLSETAGLLGYAFAEVRPQFDRDKDKREMNVTFNINEAARNYVERININGNTLTHDAVIRREFRLAEGDAFNSFKVKRTRDRINGLGFFQEKFDIEQKPGSAPDKVILEANVQEKPTGSISVSAGYSSLERFILSLSVSQRNFRGLGQELRASASLSSYSKSIEAGFTEPYLFNRNLALGFDLFRRDNRSFRYTGNGNDRNTTYKQVSTGGQVRVGFPITEYWAASVRYGLSLDEITLDSIYFTNGACDPLLAGRYLCDSIGKRTTSSVGYSVIFDDVNNRLRPSAGQRFTLSQDLAGVGGGVKYLRTRSTYDIYYALFGSGFVLNVGAEAGYIYGYDNRSLAPGQDKIRINDRFFLGEPQIRGFRIRGVGPRVQRNTLDANGVPLTSKNSFTDDAIGGRTYYRGRIEVQIPLGAAGSELGLRPSVFVDAGAVFGVARPTLSCQQPPPGVPQLPASLNCAANNGTTGSAGFREFFLGDTPRPRVSVGAGVSWNSPFGPFRFDLAKALIKSPGDDTQLFQFNVGTQF